MPFICKCDNRTCKKTDKPCILGCYYGGEEEYCLCCGRNYCPYGVDVNVIFVPALRCTNQ